MCPLRLILIFLSATLAGFFVLRNLRSQPHVEDNDDAVDEDAAPHTQTSDSSNPSSNGNSKVDPFPPFVSILLKMFPFSKTLNFRDSGSGCVRIWVLDLCGHG